MFLSVVRTRLGAALGFVAVIAATGAGAATIHRYAVTTGAGAGSGGALEVLQSSATGGGVQGEVASSAKTTVKQPFGVLGIYDATGSTFGSGVLGIATTGYGVGAESLSASQPSLIALNSSGGPATQSFAKNGGDGFDAQATGGGVGIYAESDSNNAIQAYSATDGDAAVYTADSSQDGGYGVAGNSFSSGGMGTYGYSAGGVGLQAQGESNTQGLPALQAFTNTAGTELFDAGVSDSNTSSKFSVSTVLSSVSHNASTIVYTGGVASSDLQMNGDIYLSGALYTDCDTNIPYVTDPTNDCGGKTVASVRSNRGADYRMYESAEATKTVEDEGEASLRGGVAHVALDPAFASVISTREPYLVFITPKGDSHGLYVANNSLQGFDVHENGGGRSSLAFDYRIVAHPYGEEVKRMALAPSKKNVIKLGGFPAPSRALAAHDASLAHLRSVRAHQRTLRMLKMPASLASATSFTTH